MTGAYDYALAALSVVIACFAACADSPRLGRLLPDSKHQGMAPRIQDYFRLLLQRRRVKRSFKNFPHASVLKSKLYKFAARA
jgi:hypothetical protein